MSNLIDKQQAIDAVEHITSSMSVCVNTDECHGMKRMQRQAVLELANMPSAQPSLTQMDQELKPTCADYISRQVLDLWNRYKPTIAVDAIEYDGELKKLLGMNLVEVGTEPTNIVKNCNDKSSGSDDYSYKSAEIGTEQKYDPFVWNDNTDGLIDRAHLLKRLQDFVEWCRDDRLDGTKFCIDVIKDEPSAQPTIFGYNVEHLELIASVLQKENLPPERITEILTDIGRIVAIVSDEFAETLRKAVEQCKI